MNQQITLFSPQSIKTIQKEGPYLLSGYSFGACVAMEIAAQMEAAGEMISHLTLLDGSHNFVSDYTGMYRDKRTITSEALSETEALLNFVQQFLPGNTAKVKEKKGLFSSALILNLYNHLFEKRQNLLFDVRWNLSGIFHCYS